MSTIRLDRRLYSEEIRLIMKKTSCISLLVVLFSLFLGIAQAADHSSKRARPSENTMASSERSSHSSERLAFGLGVSSIQPIGFAPVGGGEGVPGSLTAVLGFTKLDAIQAFVAIPGTVQTFQFGVGALFKHTVFQAANSGVHLGGGLGLGTNGEFSANILGVVGLHYAIGGSNIVLHVDGGPVFTIQKVKGGGTDGGSSSQTSFGVGALSSLIGASLVYMF